jgi:phosphopantothenoylcysteine decarboxylase / phosphopantothenate---cysteine ligase
MKRILLIIGGGIAAYKALELIRELTKRGDWSNANSYQGGC